jgi:hypothetical protein
VLSRAVFEGSAVLGYIAEQGADRSRYAELFDRYRGRQLRTLTNIWNGLLEAQKRGKEHDIAERPGTPEEIAETYETIEEWAGNHEELRSQLWTGPTKDGEPCYGARDEWNGLQIEETCKRVPSIGTRLYLAFYRTACTFAHPSPLASDGFATEFGTADPDYENLRTGLVATTLLKTIWLELTFAEALVDVRPALGVPSEEECDRMRAKVRGLRFDSGA